MQNLEAELVRTNASVIRQARVLWYPPAQQNQDESQDARTSTTFCQLDRSQTNNLGHGNLISTVEQRWLGGGAASADPSIR